MPLNRDYLGREYPSSTFFEVGREHIRAFAQAIGDPNPIYVDPEAAKAAGHPDVIAPPTYLTVLTMRFGGEGAVADPGLGLNYAMVVHGEQKFQLHRPIVAGDRLRATTKVSDIRNAGRNELLVVTSEVTEDGTGEHVATLTSTIVSRGTAATQEG